MKVTIVMGFFLPLPPIKGGATEKSWHRLAPEFVRRGHEVTIVSRSWPNWPDHENRNGVHYVRIPGFTHSTSLAANLWRDLRWSYRVRPALPRGDITVVNAVTFAALPYWPSARAGRLAVMVGRMPKGQFRFYRSLDRILAVSESVRRAIVHEKPDLAPIVRVTGYPIDWRNLTDGSALRSPSSPVTIGYVGRIHREKGLDLLVDALTDLSRRPGGNANWRAVVCGPIDVAAGGSGKEYVEGLQRRLPDALRNRCEFLPPIFDDTLLAQLYRTIDVFCYPSVAEHGETFGVAVAEAMAAGAVPVVSALDCFADIVRPERNGLVFDHRIRRPARLLADNIARIVNDSSLRATLAMEARESTRRFDIPTYAETLLRDFSSLQQTEAA